MGSRIGYCVKSERGRSPILRKQWAGSTEYGVTDMWKTLGGNPGGGGQAIRADLDIGRGFAAMVSVFYDPPFNSVQMDTNCDISDNGLIEVDITLYDKWKVYHIEIGWDDGEEGKEGKKTLIAEMNIRGFEWKITPSMRERIGEGLF